MALLLLVFLPACPQAQASTPDPFRASIPSTFEFAAKQLDMTASMLPTMAYPASTAPGGNWNTTGPGEWTSGFLSGSFWLMYQYTGEPIWRTRAQQWQAGIESQKSRTDEMDLGFMVLNSFGLGHRLTGDEAYRQIVLTAASTFARRYEPELGYIRSRGEPSDLKDFKVIISSLVNLELLFWASRNGGEREWYEIAYHHALKARDDFVRSDGGTYHVVNLDPRTGALAEQGKEKGCRWNSTWARGQAWALYGFTMAYRETSDGRFLETARRTADHFLDHLPADKVPYWDFLAPGVPEEPRDSSAAAIAASALIELSQLETSSRRAARYWTAARDILLSLSSPAYLARNKPLRSILRHGTDFKPLGNYDSGLIQGDYYFLEALIRYSAARPPPGVSLQQGRLDPGQSPSGPEVTPALTTPAVQPRTLTREGGGFPASLEEQLTQSDDISTSFFLRVESMPSSGEGIVSLRSAHELQGNILLLPSGELLLRNGETEVGLRSFALEAGQLYRIGLRQRKDSGPYVILEAYVAKGEDAFGCPFASSRVRLSSSTANRLSLGRQPAMARRPEPSRPGGGADSP
ncbi:glycoside hydrolase family 88 protein [Archangium violaceum]|uniref:glycoside hydrolase family 88 protein n=1 Tax=Archangium violaceum TaxID=83451 RepID=UPI002B28F6FF|nr:glycoside hydrolase family 88 protein [Archangium gephyra]